MSGNKLELRERETGGTLVAWDVIGELTAAGGHELLLERVRQKLDGGRRLLVVNLSQCRRVDSAGLGELVNCLVTATRHGTTLRLVAVPQPIRGLMKMANLLKAFEVFETEEEASRIEEKREGAH